MTLEALIFTIAAIGISETAYLIKKRKAGEKPVCLLGEDCQKVLQSKYSKIFGIHNDILGLFFYIFVSVITGFLVTDITPIANSWFWDLAMRFAVLAGALMSFFLIYLQWKVIKSWCFWCLMSAGTTFLMAAILLIKS